MKTASNQTVRLRHLAMAIIVLCGSLTVLAQGVISHPAGIGGLHPHQH